MSELSAGASKLDGSMRCILDSWYQDAVVLGWPQDCLIPESSCNNFVPCCCRFVFVVWMTLLLMTFYGAY